MPVASRIGCESPLASGTHVDRPSGGLACGQKICANIWKSRGIVWARPTPTSTLAPSKRPANRVPGALEDGSAELAWTPVASVMAWANPWQARMTYGRDMALEMVPGALLHPIHCVGSCQAQLCLCLSAPENSNFPTSSQHFSNCPSCKGGPVSCCLPGVRT